MKVIFLCLFLGCARGANILAFFNYPSYSHLAVFTPITKELSLRGHQVTVITTMPLNDPNLTNLTEIDVSVGRKALEKYDLTLYSKEHMHPLMVPIMFRKFIEESTTLQFETPEVQNLLRKNDTSFDLIIIEAHFPSLYALQAKFKAPLIAISSLFVQNYLHYMMGNPNNPSLYPSQLFDLNPPLNFWERWQSFYLETAMRLINHFYMNPQADKFARKYFGDDIPYIEEFVKNTSMMFLNVNPLFSSRRPYAPNVIEMSQMHIKPKQKLPKDLQIILDEAKHGAVYFSLGTNVRLTNIPNTFEKTVIESLGKLPYTVLLKWYTEDIPNKPKNVIVRKWYPQQDILGHRNVKVFVTQAGLQSCEEAISNAVPMVAMPFLGDQPINAKKLVSNGVAIEVNPVTITKERLVSAVMEVAKNEKYKLKALEAQNIFHDQPVKALDQIVWWCEYVIRHKGARHLRSPAADIPLYQYFLLDVIFASLAVIVLFVYAWYQILVVLSNFFKSNKVKTN